MSSAVGGFNVIEFSGHDDIKVNPMLLTADRLTELESQLYLVFTRIQRCASQIEGKKLGRMADMQDTFRLIHQMVDRGHAILSSSGSLAPFGDLLHQGWLAKRSLEAGVSNPQIDALYERGCRAGARGGKLLGAGGGGFLLFFVPPEKSAAFLAEFSDSEVIRPRLAAPGATVIFSS